MRSNQIRSSGYTLVELLIVISIIGLLSSMAIPFYQDYVARAQLTGPVNLGGAYRVVIEDFILEEGAFPKGENGLFSIFGKLVSDPEDDTKISFKHLNLISNISLTPNKEIEDEGKVVIDIDADKEGKLGIKKDIRGKSITFTRDQTGWSCTTNAAKSVTPKGCKSDA